MSTQDDKKDDKKEKFKLISPGVYQIVPAQPEPSFVEQLIEQSASYTSKNIIKNDQEKKSAESFQVEDFLPSKLDSDAADLQSLQQNLRQLADLQTRLRFMIQELEDLIEE